MSDEEDVETHWSDDDDNVDMQAAAAPGAGPSTSSVGQSHGGNHGFSASSSSTTPAHSTVKRKQSQLSRRSQNGPSTKKKKDFTTKMKDRQARGKDYYNGSSDDDSSDSDYPRMEGFGANWDSYEVEQRKRLAAITLDTPELLMMHASARGDSIPGTRHHFTKIMTGYTSPEHDWPFAESYEDGQKKKNSIGRNDYDKNGNMVNWPGSGLGDGNSHEWEVQNGMGAPAVNDQ